MVSDATLDWLRRDSQNRQNAFNYPYAGTLDAHDFADLLGQVSEAISGALEMRYVGEHDGGHALDSYGKDQVIAVKSGDEVVMYFRPAYGGIEVAVGRDTAHEMRNKGSRSALRKLSDRSPDNY